MDSRSGQSDISDQEVIGKSRWSVKLTTFVSIHHDENKMDGDDKIMLMRMMIMRMMMMHMRMMMMRMMMMRMMMMRMVMMRMMMIVLPCSSW